MTNERCENCRYFKHLQATGLGQCRRNAPVPALAYAYGHAAGIEAFRARWPVLEAADWCGQWMPLPLEVVKPVEKKPEKKHTGRGMRVELPTVGEKE